jgi:hypothetical protein
MHPLNNDSFTVLITYLYDARSIEDTVAHRLEPFHVLKYFSHSHVLRINNPESCHVYKVVFEVFQIERLDVLHKHEKSEKSFIRNRPTCTRLIKT